MIDKPPPIRDTRGNGLVVQLYQRGGEHRERVRKFAWRLYHEGVQWAFHYYETDADRKAMLQRLVALINGGDE
jgi:hypothetical protein